MMTRIQMACWALVASAFVLGAILVAELGSVSNQAKANMVIDRDNFSLMTARTANGVDSLFVLDNTHGELLIYNMNVPNNRLDLVGSVNLNQAFGAGGIGAQQGGGGQGGGGQGGGR